MATEFQIYMMKRVMELDGVDGCMTPVNVFKSTEVDTYKWLRW